MYARRSYKRKYIPKFPYGGNTGQSNPNQNLAAIGLAGQGLNAIGGPQDTNMTYGTNSYFNDRNQSMQSGQQVANTVGAIPIVGAFKALGEGAQNAIAKKDAYGVSNSSDAAVAIGGFLNPLESTTSAITDISKGEFNGKTLANLVAPGLGAVLNNNENRKNRDALQAQQQATQDANNKAIADQQAQEQADYDKVQQDNYNKAYYSANPNFTNRTGSIYARYGGMIPRYGEGGNIPSGYKTQHGSFSRVSNRDLQQVWNSDPNNIGKEYNTQSDSTMVNGKPYYNYYLYNKNSTPVDNSYNQNTVSIPSSTIDPTKQIGYNGMLAPIVEQYEDGGNLNKIASDIVKAVGNTHEEGGITLENKSGNPYAEVEDQEIIKGNNVYSDKLKLPNGNTMAAEAEKWAKIKGNSENKLRSGNYRQRNSANRLADIADKNLDDLFDYQESIKSPQYKMGGKMKYDDGGNIPPDENRLTDMNVEDPSEGFRNSMPSGQSTNQGQNYSQSGNYSQGWQSNLIKGTQAAVPYLDNIYNANLINQTPNIPVPTKKVAYYATAMPMKTNYDVNNNLTDANNAYRGFTQNLNNTTDSSQISRGNQLAGFSKLLQNKSSIYQNKENVETGLENQNNQNIQNVSNYNTQNKQNIDNTNLGQTDAYNWANMQRTEGMLHAKSANVANAVENAQTQFQDYNAKNNDSQRMFTYASSQPDGGASTYARSIGTPAMANYIKSDSGYRQVESALKNSGQTSELNRFYQVHGKR